MSTTEQMPWVGEGLHFSCTQCGRCCGGAPGEVWISEAEIAALAAHLGLAEDAFRRRYTIALAKRGVSLRDKGRSQDYHCVFYQPERGCTVYAQRPRQCRTWPFWRSVLRSRRSWYEHALDCPGMNRGQFHDYDIIASTAADDGIVIP